MLIKYFENQNLTMLTRATYTGFYLFYSILFSFHENDKLS